MAHKTGETERVVPIGARCSNWPSLPHGQLPPVLSPTTSLNLDRSTVRIEDYYELGELPKKKTGFFWEISPKYGWVGWLTPKQGPNPSKPPQIAPKIAFFDPNFTFCSPKSHKNPGVGGWINTFGRDLPKKNIFFYSFPNVIHDNVYRDAAQVTRMPASITPTLLGLVVNWHRVSKESCVLTQ